MCVVEACPADLVLEHTALVAVAYNLFKAFHVICEPADIAVCRRASHLVMRCTQHFRYAVPDHFFGGLKGQKLLEECVE